ncbi:putative peptide transporter ptr2 [Beauveria bassiana]|uniref:Putative peptide transporter ptr2 n=1 Tax=Beauveria bassiana TaxID=176275 RepID=A0A2N6NE90_BEABA|nr:putative peptide transporter ptr2 [Beauveria bassiana]
MLIPEPIILVSDRTPLLQAESDVARAAAPATTNSTALLRRVADALPRSFWSIATIEFCERFAYFGIVAPMQNYLQNTTYDAMHRGGIGAV